MSHNFALASTQHPAFGRLVTLSVAGQPPRRFTAQEASIVALALAAVVAAKSVERRIYMSPIASDREFSANVENRGVVITLEGFADVALDWGETVELARALARFGDASSQNLVEAGGSW
ncbi:MAG: hypothetical protein WB816_08135 [Methylocystis sp.]